MIIVAEPCQQSVTLTGFGMRKTLPILWKYDHAFSTQKGSDSLRECISRLMGDETLDAISFRLTFGDDSFKSPVRINDGFSRQLEQFSSRFPLHIPTICAIINLFSYALKGVPQFAYFETAFFSGLPAREKCYPIATHYSSTAEILKHGFHGIYHKWHADQPGVGNNVISIVLDRHTTVCAIRDGSPVAVSLGNTPLEGVMSMRSCGDIDPGIIIYLMKEQNLSPYKIDDILKNKSGFYGMTGFDLPLDDLITLYEKDTKVTLAFDVYKNQILKYIGDYIVELHGFDSIIFGGRHVQGLERIIYALAKDLSFLGMPLVELPWDDSRELCRITADSSLKNIYVNSLDETDIICRDTHNLLNVCILK
ncbi:MAG: hypothetical protein ABSH12_05450 [Endomicrobiales bacterium]|jgi:acetate kinase